MKLKVKKLNPNAILPTQATKGSVGWDLYIPTNATYESILETPDHMENEVHISAGVRIRPNVITTIDLGLAIEIPKGYWGLVAIRSSLGKEGIMLANSIGVIDSDYRGELRVMLCSDNTWKTLSPGDRVAQLIIQKVNPVEIEEVDDLSPTDRGHGGFGSSGR